MTERLEVRQQKQRKPEISAGETFTTKPVIRPFNSEQKELFAFVTENPELFSVVLETYHQARLAFPNSKIEFEVHDDPEILNFSQLVMRILSDLPVNEALDRLRSLDPYLFAAAQQSKGRFLVDVGPIA